MKVDYTIAPHRVEGIRIGGVPHAIAPVLKYKARGVKRIIPWKYSTYLSMEAKDSGQDHFLLKGEG